MLWVRNVLINWLIFLPALFALAHGPRALYRPAGGDRPRLELAAAAGRAVCLGVGVYTGPNICRATPTPTPSSQGRRAIFVPLRVVRAADGVGGAGAAGRRALAAPGDANDAVPGDVIPWLGFVVTELAFMLVAWRANEQDGKMLWYNFGWWTLASLWRDRGAVGGAQLRHRAGSQRHRVLGPFAVTLAHLVQSLTYVALRTEAFRGDLDREWLARLNGEKVVPALLWAGFAGDLPAPAALVLDRWSTKFVPFVVSAFGLADRAARRVSWQDRRRTCQAALARPPATAVSCRRSGS